MKAIKLGIILLPAMAACAIGFASTASADTAPPPGPGTHILVGGDMDCTSKYLESVKADQGDLQGTPVPITYGTCDGDFAPVQGSTSAPDAIAQGVAATRAAWDQNCANGERCTLEGFSIGAAPVAIVGKDVGADKPGSNTHVVTDGNAYGAPGVFGKQPGVLGGFVNVGAPFIGAPTHIDQVPGSENRLGVNGFWENDSGQSLGPEIAMASCINGCNGDVPAQHNVPGGEPTNTFVDGNGVVNKVYGVPFQGVTNPADNPVINPPDAPASVASVTSAVPSFFGELACVAPDGGQYFTPGNAPC